VASPVELRGRRVAVVGLGKSGLAVARFCAERGAQVVGCDDRDEAALASALLPLQGDLAAGRLQLALGGLRPEPLVAADLIVLSPGVPPSRAPIVAAQAAGVSITGEIELASRFIAAPIVGITGTNGKSTVTSLCGAIAEASGRPSFCGGNLGTPLCTAIDTAAATEAGIVVVELSSYQLETAQTLTCTAATVLNLTPDHLDRYPSLAAYGDAKARIFANMQPLATRVWNADDPEVLALCERRLGVGQPGYPFSLHGPVPPQYLMERSLRLGGWVQPLLKLLAHGRRLRGSALDLFGRTAERRLERQLIADFEARVAELLTTLDRARLPLATDLAKLPLSVRGYGHVKLGQLAVARAREAELLHRWDPVRYPRPLAAVQAGQFKGIAVVGG
jgi:NAD(P)-dependent dehydrogenase (short-subunit alcohol dehydrogenase family)